MKTAQIKALKKVNQAAIANHQFLRMSTQIPALSAPQHLPPQAQLNHLPPAVSPQMSILIQVLSHLPHPPKQAQEVKQASHNQLFPPMSTQIPALSAPQHLPPQAQLNHLPPAVSLQMLILIQVLSPLLHQAAAKTLLTIQPVPVAAPVVAQASLLMSILTLAL